MLLDCPCGMGTYSCPCLLPTRRHGHEYMPMPRVKSMFASKSEAPGMETTISLNLNGQAKSITADGERPLLEVLREYLHLTGTKYGCGEGQCGACTVLIDGKRTFSCITSVADAAQKKVTTIEGLSSGDRLHPVQQAFLE